MKRFFCICISLTLLVLMVGCAAKSKEQLQAVLDTKIEAQTVYTPRSYAEYKAAFENAKKIQDNFFATSTQVESARITLVSAIENLEEKPDKSALISLVEQAVNVIESDYTTASVNALREARTLAYSVLDSQQATFVEVQNAYDVLSTSLKNLVTAQKGVYRLNCSLQCLENNHVGNEWITSVTYKGQPINNGITITSPLDSKITITGKAIECDEVPDSNSVSLEISLNGVENNTQFYVRENRGRYAGNFAKWQLSACANLIERI